MVLKEFRLKIIEAPKGVSELGLINDFRNSYRKAFFALDDVGDPSQEIKWHDSDNDLIDFSKKHQNVIFKLEERELDISHAIDTYAKGGRYYQKYEKEIYDDISLKEIKTHLGCK